jgi:ABC-2 type transport system ATP-binding protein
VATDEEDALSVVGLEASTIGDLAGAHQVVLHELSLQAASLEEAFMELTHDSVEYRGDAPPPPGGSTGPRRSAEKVTSA